MSHVLVVEDNPTVGPTLCVMLEYHGHTCSYAGNGKDALDALGAGGVDVVVTDVQLPGGISGIEIADRAKAAGIGCVPDYRLWRDHVRAGAAEALYLAI